MQKLIIVQTVLPTAVQLYFKVENCRVSFLLFVSFFFPSKSLCYSIFLLLEDQILSTAMMVKITARSLTLLDEEENLGSNLLQHTFGI